MKGHLSSLCTFQIILELCRNEETANILCVQPHLERIRPPGYTGVSESSIHKYLAKTDLYKTSENMSGGLITGQFVDNVVVTWFL